MSDLRSIMIEAVGTTPAPATPAIADADLARGRRAHRRHRLARMGAGSGLVLTAAAVGAFAITSSGGGLPSSPRPPAAAASVGQSVELVAYHGEQPTGYKLDAVPQGWEIRNDDTGALTLAPKGSKKDDDEEAVTFVNRIGISQSGESSLPTGVKRDKVEVDGKPGFIAHMWGADGKPDGTLSLFVKQPSGNYLTIQVWSGIGWNNDRIAEFAAGVHVTKDATVSVG